MSEPISKKFPEPNSLKDEIIQFVMTLHNENAEERTILETLIAMGEEVDPDGGEYVWLAHVFTLNSLGIFGHRIVTLWKYVCKSDIVNFIAVIRAYQLGQLAGVTEDALKYATWYKRGKINLDLVKEEVKKCLPNFNLEAVIV